MDETTLFTITDGLGADSLGPQLHGAAGALVDSDLDEDAADRLSVVTGHQLGRISRALAQSND